MQTLVKVVWCSMRDGSSYCSNGVIVRDDVSNFKLIVLMLTLSEAQVIVEG